MTDENLESNSPEGIAGSPNPNNSQGQSVQQSSGFDAEAMLKQLEPLIEKKVQSVKDRRIAELEKTVSGFQPVLERFKGIVPDEKLREIQKDLEFEDMKRRVYGENPTSASEVGSQKSAAAVTAESVLLKAGVTANDPAIAKWIQENGTEDLVSLAVFAGKQSTLATQKPDASVAPVMDNSKTTSTSLSKDEVERKSGELRNMYKSPSKYREQIKALEKELDPYLPK